MMKPLEKLTRYSLALICLLSLVPSAALHAKEYILTAARPNHLFLIDTVDGSVARTYKVPDQIMGSWSIVPSPDNRFVYMATDRHQSMVGLDLDTGEVVFRADLSHGNEWVRSHYGQDISSDGKELYVYVNPVKRLPDEYQNLEARVLVFDTSAGLDAKPIRTLPAPRRIVNLMVSSDRKSIYLAGMDIFQIDANTGELLDTFPINSWQVPNRSPGNAYGNWASWEQSGINTMMTISVHTDRDPYSVEAYQSSILQINRDSGDIEVWDFEYLENLIFSAVTSPTRPEIFATYNTLAKIDAKNHKTVKRVPLESTFYAVNVSGDGDTVFVGGGGCKVAAHSAENLEKVWSIELPGCADQSQSNMRIVNR